MKNNKKDRIEKGFYIEANEDAAKGAAKPRTGGPNEISKKPARFTHEEDPQAVKQTQGSKNNTTNQKVPDIAQEDEISELDIE